MSKHHNNMGGQSKVRLRLLRNNIALQQNNKCYHCKKDTIHPTKSGYSHNWQSLEHIEKISEGGESKVCNFVMLCMQCNTKRIQLSKGKEI